MNRPPKKKKRPRPDAPPPGYVAQIQAMSARARAWVATHPGLSPKIQWNFPQHVIVAMSITEGLELHFVFVDAIGQLLLDAMLAGPRQPGDDEPTISQVRMALELIEHELPGIVRSACPACGALGECLTGMTLKGGEKSAPVPGETPIICAACGALNLLDEGRQLRAATPAELADFDASPEFSAMIQAARAALVLARSKHPPR